MNICDDHWAKLKQAIADRGLDHLCAKTGEAAMEKVVADLEGRQVPFDPLLGSSTAIFNNALQAVGLVLLNADPETGKPPCPLCYLIANCQCRLGDSCDIHRWIDHASDAALDHARELGLVATS